MPDEMPQRGPIRSLTASPPSTTRRSLLHRLLIPGFVFALLLLGCSAADLVQRDVTPTAPPTRQPAPTFTNTPEEVGAIIIVTPPSQGTPGVIIVPPGTDPRAVIPVPTDTPTSTPLPDTGSPTEPGQPAPQATSPLAPAPPTATATDTATPLPTPTPTDTPTPTATATPTPYIQVQSGLVNLRQGPGVEYPLVAQLGPEIPVAIIGQNPEGTWLQICCVSGESVWVARNHVLIGNDASVIALVLPGPPPSATPTGTPTITPTVTPTPTPTRYPFDRAIGPQFFPSNNEFLTIWAKLFVKPDPNLEEDPAEGYYLTVLYEGFERPSTNDVVPSANTFYESAARGAGNRVLYNFKYEYLPPDPGSLDCNSVPETLKTACTNRTLTRKDLLGTGRWIVYVSDGAGNQLSDEVEFTTSPSNANREIYIGWNRVR